MKRKIFATVLCVALLSGCFHIGAQMADTTPTRVVSTFFGKGAQGFHWYTTVPAPSEVLVNGTIFVGTSEEFQGGYAHRVVAEGLAPGSYSYDIAGVQGTFAVDPGPGTGFSFAVIADVQAKTREEYDAAAQVLRAAGTNNAFSVNLGDFTDDCDNAQWDTYFDAFAGTHLSGTLVPAAGNHDGNLKWNWFRNMFTLKEPKNFLSNLTGVYYSFDYGDAHFAVLNTNDMYPMSQQQRNWLLNDMHQSDAKWKILLMHRAAYSAGKNINKPDTLIMRRLLLPIIDETGIDLVLAGHDHMYYRSQPVKNDQIAGTIGSLNLPAGALDYEDAYMDPAGAVHVLPNTAGPKRYQVNKSAITPILEVARIAEQPNLPVYSVVAIEDDTLEYKAYTYDAGAPAETAPVRPLESFVIQKTNFFPPDPAYRPLPTDALRTLPGQVWSTLKSVAVLLFADYIGTLLPQALGLG
ncbi:MAG: metallophosphoesterase family protein [Oscillospiraceae bacterium]|nr:metallophosphoesterase family protein [Oscillospiraceae bacterium]